MNIKKWLNGICLSIIMIAGLFMVETSARAGTVHDSPYVTKSPDGKAFTFNHKDTNWEWYDKGTEVTTGIPPLRDAEEGEHKYQYKRKGSIPIKKWVVEHKTATCCHNGYPDEEYYHGIDYGRQHCLGRYYSGWNSYCADCEESISNLYMYMSKEAAQSITELDIDLEHYYTCPHCKNLEQGRYFDYHNCKAISWNKYKIEYKANTIDKEGDMAPSTHMYNNATEYEGEPITPATRLTKNAYTRTGYEFMGWNTKPDCQTANYNRV